MYTDVPSLSLERACLCSSIQLFTAFALFFLSPVNENLADVSSSSILITGTRISWTEIAIFCVAH